MRIQHNIMAMNSYRNYTNNVNSMKANLEKLSSGYKINRAGDDAAGLAISEKMRAQVTALKQAQNNAKSGINLVQTAEGALQEVQDMLNRMVKLAEQSANGTYDNNVDRYQLQKEFDKLTDEIDRINQSANFNGMALFGGPGEADGAGGDAKVMEAAPADGGGLTNVKITGLTEDIKKVQINTVAGGADTNNGKAEAAFANGTLTITVTGKGTGGGAPTEVTADDITAAIKVATGLTDDQKAALADVSVEATVGTIAAATGTAVDTTEAAAPAPAPEWDDADAAATELAKYNIASIDLKDVELEEDAAVKASYDGTTKKLAVTIGDKTYTQKAAFTGNAGAGDAAAGAKVVLADDAGNEIEVTLADTVDKIGLDQTADIAEADIGTMKAASNAEGATAIGSYNLQIGDTSDPWNRITVNRYSIGSASLKDISEGTNKTLSQLKIGDETSAGQALTSLKGMVNYISDIRGELGATQNRLNHTINNLSVMEENIQDAESTIRDTDVAEEMMAYTKNNILIQSAQAMLAQANQVPQGVLQLLG